jgi:hypothetical protein
LYDCICTFDSAYSTLLGGLGAERRAITLALQQLTTVGAHILLQLRSVNAKPEQKVVFLPLLGIDPVTFGTL